MLKVEQITNGCHNVMSNVFRYSLARVIQRENLAEHSFYVAFIADIIAEDLVNTYTDVKVNREKILRYALMHDIEEIGTGDIVHTPKYRSKKFRTELENIGGAILKEKLADSFGKESPVTKLILKYNRDYETDKYSTIEGNIVKIADLIQSLSYCLSEMKSGNLHFTDITKNIKDQIIKNFKDHVFLGKYVNEIIEFQN